MADTPETPSGKGKVASPDAPVGIQKEAADQGRTTKPDPQAVAKASDAIHSAKSVPGFMGITHSTDFDGIWKNLYDKSSAEISAIQKDYSHKYGKPDPKTGEQASMMDDLKTSLTPDQYQKVQKLIADKAAPGAGLPGSSKPQTDIDRIVSEFNQGNADGYTRGVTDLLALKKDEDAKGTKASNWNSDLQAINDRVNLKKLGFADAGELLDVRPDGTIVTSDTTGTIAQSRDPLDGLKAGDTDKLTDQEKALDASLKKQTQEDDLQKLGPGDHTVTLTVDGKARTFDVHVPPNDGKEKLGVMYMFDGTQPNDKMNMRAETGVEGITQKDKMIIVYPHALFKTGVPGPGFDKWHTSADMMAWNSEHSGVTTWDKSYDDSHYFDAVMSRVNSSLNVDKTNQHLYGFGEGGEVANEMDKEHPGVFASKILVQPTELVQKELPDPANNPTATFITLSNNTFWMPPTGGRGFMTGNLPEMDGSQPLKLFADAAKENGCLAVTDTHDDAGARQVKEASPQECTSGAPVVQVMRDYHESVFFGHGSGQFAIDGPGKGGLWLVGEKDPTYDVTARSWDLARHYRKMPDGKMAYVP